MLVLALDTSTRGGSLALLRDEMVLEVATGDPARPHAERLPADILALINRHHVTLADIDAYAVAAGPGSFTGLRIGIATIQGLAFANDRPVASISALDALALTAMLVASETAVTTLETDEPLWVAACMDAQRGEVYTELCRAPRATFQAVVTRGASMLDQVDEAAVGHPDALARRWLALVGDHPIIVVGDGALVYRDILVGALGSQITIVEPVPPLAPMIGGAGVASLRAGRGVPPHAIRPLYVRRPDAELARDRRAAAGRDSSG